MTLRLLTAGGLPDGTLFGIDTEGTLRWYRYVDGGGDESVGAGVAPWLYFDTNSGNPIGNGWGEFSWIAAGIHGTLVGIDGEGNLRIYYYTGNGESDWGGEQNWDPQSGAILASGFDKWRHLALLLNDGDWSTGATDLQILTVDDSGDARVHYWRSGELVSGTPVIVAHDWTDYEYIFGANLGRAFAVGTSGLLYWHQIWVGLDASVTIGDHDGNAIGQGWDTFATLASGWNTQNSAGINNTVYGIDPDHNLRWYGYNGGGVADATGSTGWVLGSGNIISGSW